MTQPRTELQLYQLLWEQIKDRDIPQGLCAECYRLFEIHDFDIISQHIQENMPILMINGRRSIFGWALNEYRAKDRKLFVQRMIETLTKEQSI